MNLLVRAAWFFRHTNYIADTNSHFYLFRILTSKRKLVNLSNYGIARDVLTRLRSLIPDENGFEIFLHCTYNDFSHING